jgi:hypothetical protein
MCDDGCWGARRAYGCDTPVGFVYGINPFMIIFLVPVVGALTTGFTHFDMIHYGSYVSALSPFWIVAFPTHGALPPAASFPMPPAHSPACGIAKQSTWRILGVSCITCCEDIVL